MWLKKADFLTNKGWQAMSYFRCLGCKSCTLPRNDLSEPNKDFFGVVEYLLRVNEVTRLFVPEGEKVYWLRVGFFNKSFKEGELSIDTRKLLRRIGKIPLDRLKLLQEATTVKISLQT